MRKEELKEQFRNEWHNLPPEVRQKYRRRGQRMFIRFLIVFGLIVMLIVGGISGLIYLIGRIIYEDHFGSILWMGGAMFLFLLPIFAIYLSLRAYRDITSPLAEVIAAADNVSKGDLSVRVRENLRGNFAGLAKSFNHMVSELEMADERRRNLTADVAHELRTPLHIIQGNLEGVLDEVYEPSTDHIEATLDETRILARLIEDLRVLSLAESGQLPLQKEEVDIAELLQDVETSFSGQAAVAGVGLNISTQGNLKVQADYGRLTQVINNLVTNGLRHTPAGGQINISAQNGADQISITVEDTGEGIPAEQLPYIFDRFWRGDKSREHTGSTGLGLAIARQLMLAHGGDIAVKSTKGEGTIFTVVL